MPYVQEEERVRMEIVRRESDKFTAIASLPRSSWGHCTYMYMYMYVHTVFSTLTSTDIEVCSLNVLHNTSPYMDSLIHCNSLLFAYHVHLYMYVLHSVHSALCAPCVYTVIQACLNCSMKMLMVTLTCLRW